MPLGSCFVGGLAIGAGANAGVHACGFADARAPRSLLVQQHAFCRVSGRASLRMQVERHAADDASAMSPPLPRDGGGIVPDYVQKLVALLQDDLPKMFEYEHEPDWSIYAKDVVFTDPITKFTGVAPYKANIRMLKNSPIFYKGQLQIRDIQTVERGPGRWSVVTQFTLCFVARPLPWKPRLMFTGTSEYCVGEDELVYEHIDRWDSIENQSFLSFEALGNVLSMLKPGGRGVAGTTVRGEVMRVYRDFEVREYSACAELSNVEYKAVGDGDSSCTGPAPGWYGCMKMRDGATVEQEAGRVCDAAAKELFEVDRRSAIVVGGKNGEVWVRGEAQW